MDPGAAAPAFLGLDAYLSRHALDHFLDDGQADVLGDAFIEGEQLRREAACLAVVQSQQPANFLPRPDGEQADGLVAGVDAAVARVEARVGLAWNREQVVCGIAPEAAAASEAIQAWAGLAGKDEPAPMVARQSGARWGEDSIHAPLLRL